MNRWQPLVALLAAFATADASPLFDDSSVLDVTLEGPLAALFEDPESLQYRPFELRVGEERLDVEVRLRGHSRRRVCDFPPLRIKLGGNAPAGSVFADQDGVKLVSHCRNGDRGEQDLLEEYLAYRILNLLTERSFRVRLLKVEYLDPSGDLHKAASPRFGFVIEPIEQLAARLGGTVARLPGLPKARHDREQAALVYVFQYLVGNTDWSLALADYDDGCCHNHKLIDAGERVYLVPYDFDLSGVVNARYAFPQRDLPIKKVTQRLYQGACTDRDILLTALRSVLERRDELLSLVDQTPGLDASNVRRMRKYLDAFFRKGESKLMRIFERDCI